MSSKRYRNFTKREARRLALAATRDHGCTCEPEIHVRSIIGPHCEVRHDTWCTLHNAGRYYHLVQLPEGCDR